MADVGDGDSRLAYLTSSAMAGSRAAALMALSFASKQSFITVAISGLREPDGGG
jgi:hypothetical protein